jgi:hypothetical protein
MKQRIVNAFFQELAEQIFNNEQLVNIYTNKLLNSYFGATYGHNL